jgi:Flp pilus assembly protein TadG
MRQKIAILADRLRIGSSANQRIRSAIAKLAADRRGVSAVLIGFMLPVMIGFVGLALDVSYWEINKRDLQGAADQAVFSAAVAAGRSADAAQTVTQAKAVMASMGYVDGADGVVVTVSNPATVAPYTTNINAWQVRATKTQDMFFSGLFLSTSPTITAQAVALRGTAQQITTVPGTTTYGNPGCILTLSTTAAQASNFNNNAGVTNVDCAVYTNSNAANALSCSNNCYIQSDTYTVGGQAAGTSVSSGLLGVGTTAAPRVHKTGQNNVPDPYGALVPPTATTLPPGTVTRIALATATSLLPGYYPAGINSTVNALTLQPGTYYIGTKFKIKNGATVTADGTGGVTIILMNGLCVGNMNSSGVCNVEGGLNGVTLNLKAPTTGTYAGIAMYAPGTTTSKLQEFHNSVHLNVQGALYFPKDHFSIHNNGSFSSALCAQVVANTSHFENNANMGTVCTGTGVATIRNTTTTPSSLSTTGVNAAPQMVQ